MYLILILLMILCIILGVAFITLYERHILSLSQNRVGPSKISFMGILQAGLDGVKLIVKEQILLSHSSEIYFLIIPGVCFIFMFLEWLILPFMFFFLNMQFSFLFFLCLVGFSVYFTIISGVMSNSKFSFIGSLRASSQSVSFEVSLSIYLIIFFFLLGSMNLVSLFNLSILFFGIPLMLMILAELNRAPFDFSEGESELVSGFNTEHSSVSFVFLFLGEYGILIFFSILFSCLFFYQFIFMNFFMFSLLLLIRSVYPRYRYDLLMEIFWKKILPFSIFLFFFFFVVFYSKCMFFSFNFIYFFITMYFYF